ncbi:MAG TPA: NifU family protein [candidate division Zixibacteria bacterium]|nr:NifU family protein [candidate division Zixibacteria bacterium]
MTQDTQQIKITGEPSLDPQVCKFHVDHPIFPDGSYNCRDKEMAEGSPLLQALFEIDGITQVMVSGSTLTIAKNNPQPWPAMGKLIGSTIREQIRSGSQLIDPNVQKKLPSEEKIRQQIEELFEQEINPQIASHGGKVELVDVDGTTVYLRLGGGCQGCASANVTLKNGIEKAIRAIIPEVTDIVDATDHASGASPYY